MQAKPTHFGYVIGSKCPCPHQFQAVATAEDGPSPVIEHALMSLARSLAPQDAAPFRSASSGKNA